MSNFCPSLLDSEKKNIKKLAKQVKLDVSDADILAAVSNIANRENVRPEKIVSEQPWKIIGELKSIKDRSAKASLKGKKIGKAIVKISNKNTYTDKLKIANDSETLYVYEESAQAREAVTGKPTGIEGVETIEDEALRNSMLNKARNSAIARTDINGKVLPNSAGIIVSNNNWSKTNNPQGILEKDEDKVLEIIKEDLINIRKLLESGKFKSVMFPEVIKGDMSKKLAEGLAMLLTTELGIQVLEVVPSYEGSSKYHIKLAQVTEGSTKKQKEKQAVEDAKESLSAERPTTEMAEIDEGSVDILQSVYPDLTKRKSRIDFVSFLFSKYIGFKIDAVLEDLGKLSAEGLEWTYDGGILTNADVLENLRKGDEHTIRMWAIKNITEDGQNFVSLIVNAMYEYISDIANSTVEEIADHIMDEDSLLGEMFLNEAAERGFGRLSEEGVPSKKLKKNALKRALVLKEAFSKMSDPRVFAALFDETRYDLEINEGIVLCGNVEIEGDEASMSSDSMVSNTQDSIDNNELDEENLNLGKMDFITKYRLVNPRDTLSANMRKLIGSLNKVTRNKYGEYETVYDELGMPIKLNPGVVYYILLDNMAGIRTIEDMDNRLQSMLITYPWMESIINRIAVTDENGKYIDYSLRAEFFRAMNKSYVQYGFVSAQGNLVNLNYRNASEVLLLEVTKNYEGGNVLGSHSIYDDYGSIVDRNTKYLYDILDNTVPREIQKKMSREYLRENILKKEHPLFWVRDLFDNVTKGITSDDARIKRIKEIGEALQILRGEHPEVKAKFKVSLEDLLKDLGIDTYNMSLDELLPVLDIENTEYTFDSKSGDIVAIVGEDTIPVFTTEQINGIKAILDAASNIVSRAKPGTPLIQPCKQYYFVMSRALSMVSEGYSESTFRFGDTSRYSYSVPSYIDRLVSSISSDNEEDALNYIEDNFGKFDFFQDSTGRYNNVWLRMMTEVNGNNGEIARKLRKKFKVMQILGFGGSQKANTIQNVSEKALKEGLIDMFFSANDSDNIHYAYYRNPLFSDVDAMCFFQFRRFTARDEYDEDGRFVRNFDYKRHIISELINVFKQDLNRVRDLKAGDNKEEIEFYNSGRKNGFKLNFFPEFNKNLKFRIIIDGEQKVLEGLDALLAITERQEDEDINDYNDRVNDLLYAILEDRLSELSKEFIDSIDDKYKVKLYNRLSKRAGIEVETTAEEAKDEDKLADDEEVNQVIVKIHKGYWSRESVANQKDKVFLFGDNTEDRISGYVPTSTQAVIRGLDNAIGIDTKKNRGTSEDSYFTDDDFYEFKAQVDAAIDKALLSGKTIVLPEDGIGTGKAQLQERAPRLFEYLQQQLDYLRDQVTDDDGNNVKVEASNALIEEFYYNDFLAQSQLIQLLGGDLAYYKNFPDFIKRNKQAFAGGERLYYEDENGNTLYDRGIYLEDMFRASTTIDSLKALLDSDTNLTETERAVIRGAFININTTDGQTFRTMDSFKKIYKAMGGKWTDDMDRAYKRIASGQLTPEDFQALWQSIKPFLFSFEAREVDGRMEKVVTQHKNSEYMLTAVCSLLNTALNKKSPLLKGLNKFMRDHEIDSAHFHSVVKEGYNNYIDLNYDPKEFNKLVIDGYIKVGNVDIKASSYDEFFKGLTKALKEQKITSKEYNDIIDKIQFKNETDVYNRLLELTRVPQEELGNIKLEDLKPADRISAKMLHVFPLSDYMIMQPSADHLVDEVAKFGSQLRNIVPADLPESFTVEVNGKVLNREEAINYYNEILVEKLVRAFYNIKKEFSTLKDIENMLQAKMKLQPSKYPPEIRRALTLDSTKTRFNIPANSPNLRNKIEDLILSEFKNHLQKQSINGGNAVLVSNFGLHNDLHVKYKNNRPEDGVEYIEVYLTHTMSSQLKDFLKPNKDGIELLDYDLMYEKLGKEAADELMTAIGYRIPTEDKYSMFPIKIMGFMPAIAGCTIMMPSDVIEMSGTDFDFDKLFLMLKTIRREICNEKLAKAYEKWLKNNGYTKNDGLFNSVMNVLSDSSATGFTEEEIGSFMKNPLFSMFMREEGYKEDYVTLKYNIISPNIKKTNGEVDLSETIGASNNKALDNMLIDFIFKVLTSKEGSQLMMRQGTFRDVKRSSRIERLLGNKEALLTFRSKHLSEIESEGGIYRALNARNKDGEYLFSTDYLDDFYNVYASSINPMDASSWVKNHRNLMDGNDLIGMFAVNSSSHYKLQFAGGYSVVRDSKGKTTRVKMPGIEIKKANAVRVILPGTSKGIELTKIDEVISPINGKRIGEICAQFQAAAPDNGKDPCLGDLNISPETVDLVNLLSRLGMDIVDIGTIVNSERVLHYTVEDLPDSTKIDGLDEFYLDINRLAEIKAKITIGEELDVDEAAFVISFKIWFGNLKRVSSALSSISPVIRSDSPNGALSTDYASAIQQILRLDKLESSIDDVDFPITGFSNIVDFNIIESDYSSKDDLRREFMKARIPRLQAVFSLSFTNAFPIVKELLADLSDASIDRLRLLMSEGRAALETKKYIPTIKKFITEYNMFLLTRSSLFGSDERSTLMDKRNYYIHDFPIKFKAIMNLKNEDGSYIYENIRRLPAIQRLSNKGDKGIKLDNVGKISPDVRKWYTESFNQLLNMKDVSDEEKEVAKKLAYDLVMYGFYDNGLTFRHNSYSNFFSTTFLESIPGFIESYRAAETEAKEKSETLDRRFVYQFLLNNPSLIAIISNKEVKSKGNRITILKNKDDFYPDSVYAGPASSGNYRELIALKFKGKLIVYRRVIDKTTDALTYEKVEISKDTLYYDGTQDYENIKYEELKGRANSNVKVDKLINGKPKSKPKNKSVPREKEIISDNYSDDDFLPSSAPAGNDPMDIPDNPQFTDQMPNFNVQFTDGPYVFRGKVVESIDTTLSEASKHFAEEEKKLTDLNNGDNKLCRR